MGTWAVTLPSAFSSTMLGACATVPLLVTQSYSPPAAEAPPGRRSNAWIRDFLVSVLRSNSTCAATLPSDVRRTTLPTVSPVAVPDVPAM